MPKLGVNEQCSCGSQKKYKKCCLRNVINEKQSKSESYLSGQDISSDKMNLILDHYKAMVPKYCLIDITNNLSEDNYKTYLIKNYGTNTVMFAEKHKENEDFFNLKSNSDPDIDIIIMFRGGYKVINSKRILLYDEDIKKWLLH